MHKERSLSEPEPGPIQMELLFDRDFPAEPVIESDPAVVCKSLDNQKDLIDEIADVTVTEEK